MPYYPLEKIRELAKNLNNLQISRMARRDCQNLGYYLADIANCIRLLNESDFYKTYVHENGIILDAYKTNYKNSSLEHTDSLYIKFRMVSNHRIYIDLVSFHRER